MGGPHVKMWVWQCRCGGAGVQRVYVFRVRFGGAGVEVSMWRGERQVCRCSFASRAREAAGADLEIPLCRCTVCACAGVQVKVWRSKRAEPPHTPRAHSITKHCKSVGSGAWQPRAFGLTGTSGGGLALWSVGRASWCGGEPGPSNYRDPPGAPRWLQPLVRACALKGGVVPPVCGGDCQFRLQSLSIRPSSPSNRFATAGIAIATASNRPRSCSWNLLPPLTPPGRRACSHVPRRGSGGRREGSGWGSGADTRGHRLHPRTPPRLAPSQVEWYLDYNPTLIIAPVIFPITFTISSAYRRREDALASLASFRTGCGIILVSHGAWCLELYGVKDKRFRDITPQSFFETSKHLITEVQCCMEEYLGPSTDFTEKGRKSALTRVCCVRGRGGRAWGWGFDGGGLGGV